MGSLAGPVLGRKGNWGRLTNGLWGIGGRHGRGLVWLVPGKVELSPPALGFETCKPHLWLGWRAPIAEAICIRHQFISSASLIPSLSFQITTQSKAPAAI